MLKVNLGRFVGVLVRLSGDTRHYVRLWGESLTILDGSGLLAFLLQLDLERMDAVRWDDFLISSSNDDFGALYRYWFYERESK